MHMVVGRADLFPRNLRGQKRGGRGHMAAAPLREGMTSVHVWEVKKPRPLTVPSTATWWGHCRGFEH